MKVIIRKVKIVYQFIIELELELYDTTTTEKNIKLVYFTVKELQGLTKIGLRNSIIEFLDNEDAYTRRIKKIYELIESKLQTEPTFNYNRNRNGNYDITRMF